MECLACIDIKSNHTTSKPTYVFLIISYHIISFHFSPLTNKQTDQPGPALGAHARHTLYSSGIYTYIHTCTWTCARATANQQRVPRGGGGVWDWGLSQTLCHGSGCVWVDCDIVLRRRTRLIRGWSCGFCLARRGGGLCLGFKARRGSTCERMLSGSVSIC